MLDTTIRFACDGCGKRYRVPEKHAGRTTDCPGCGACMTVPEAEPPAAASTVPDEEDEYGVEDAAPVTTVSAASYDEYAANRPAGYRSLADSPHTPRRDRQTRPAEAAGFGLGLLQGFGEFFFNPAMVSAWLGLGFALPLTLMLPMALGQFIGVFQLLATGLFIGTILVAAPIWLGLSSSIYLTIIGDAAGGARRVVEWPALDAGQWIAATIRLTIATLFASLPGVGIASAVGDSTSLLGQSLVLVSVWLGLPVVILSQLDTGAWWGVLSDGPFRTMRHAPVTWFVFYVLTLLLFAGWGVLSALTVHFLGAYALVIVCAGEAAVGLLHAWLLGRLAWTAGAATPDVRFAN